MAQEKKEYELTVIFPFNLESKQGKTELEKLEKEIKKIGNINEKKSWGEKKLAYPIKKYQSAFYYFFKIQANPQEITNFNNFLKLNENIIRYLIVAVNQ